MARTVKVDLLLDVAKYLRPAREAKRETKGVAESLDDAAQAGDKTSTALDTTAREMTDAARAAANLDRRVDELRESLRDLAVQSALTGDADIEKQMRAQQAALRKAQSARKLLPDQRALLPDMGKAAEDAVTTFGDVFGRNLPKVLARVPLGTGAAVGAAIAVPLVSTLGAAVAAGVIGGVGVGGVIGGVALASKDSRVQAAGKSLGAAVMGDLEESAGRFVQPTIHGIGIIRSAWADVAGDVDGVFAATSRYVEPLARGVAGAMREIGPGLRDAAEAAGPIIRELGDGLPRIGRAIGDLFSNLSDNADEGASAVRFIVMALEEGIGFISTWVSGLASLYRGLVEAGTAAADFSYSMYGWMPIIGDKISDNRDRMHELRDAMNKGGTAGTDAGGQIEGGLRRVESAASDATYKVESLHDMLNRLTGEALSTEESNIRLEEAIDRAADAAKNNGDGIDANIPKQRENRKALLGIASAANAAAADIYATTKSHDLASVATERGRKKFLETADAMGVEKKEAVELANKLFGIPEKRKSTVSVETKQTPIDLKTVAGRIAAIKSKRVVITVVNNTVTTRSEGRNVGIGNGIGGRRWGGITQHAQWGLLRDADIYSTRSPARYAFAEPATGGEAFVPRYGNRDRSLGILDQAARWYGARVSSAQSGGRTITINAPIHINGANQSTAQIATAVERKLGRMADLYERGA